MQRHEPGYPCDSLLAIDYFDDFSCFDRYFLFDLQNTIYVLCASFQIETLGERNIKNVIPRYREEQSYEN